MSSIQVLKFRTWEMRLSKMPRFEMPCFQMKTRVTVTSAQCEIGYLSPRVLKKLLM